MLTRKAKYFVTLSAIAPLVFAAACTDNNILSPKNVAGTYTLTEFASQTTFPMTFNVNPGDDPDLPNGGTLTVTGGTMVLGNDGTFTETNFYTKTQPGGQSFQNNFVSAGNYTISGNTIQFTAAAQNGYGPRSFNGNISSNQIIYIEGNSEFAYQR